MTPLEETTENQRLAAEPARSAFVMANAGAGKTRVLTNRVARLLLNKTDPEKILCLTFTKAAAAEMADRLFGVLGEWALANDNDLNDALFGLEGGETKPRNAGALADVRRLFARALETPGGLKIQTIHSFCESVLRRFPIEAGVAPGFSVIEDADAKAILNTALDHIARRALREPALGEAIERLSLFQSEDKLRALLIGAAEVDFTHGDDLDCTLAALASKLDVDPGVTESEIIESFIHGIDRSRFDDAQSALANSGKNAEKRCAAPMRQFLQTPEQLLQWQALRRLFVKTDGDPRANYGDKTTEKTHPWVNAYLLELESQFIAADQALKANSLFRDTAAYFFTLHALQENYRTAKANRASLDFNDLIEKTRALFNNSASAWIMYKLDHGIDHILIDEAQDTSPAQWTVIESLFEEYLSGRGARDAHRSFFAVGDMKQSIYSFQGADVDLFKEKEQDLGKRLSAISDYKNTPLTLSFRTTEPVLTFVDAMFDDPQAAEGLGEIPRHSVERDGAAGLVEIWPLCPRPETPKPKPWDKPVDEPSDDHPVSVLSNRITQTIKQWLNHKTILESQGRPIGPGDILILVQSRGPLFNEIIRQLARQGVRVAGADRLKLLKDPAIEDLLSFAKFALFTGDDLSLAETLKSPLFEFEDDQDLFPLAQGRPKEQSLWAALNRRADTNPAWRMAADQIAVARSVGLTHGPYAFLSHILEMDAPSGRRRFYERLTESSREAIDEMLRQALNFENAHPRSLRGFVHWFEENAGIVKREMDRAGEAVRVMTVHGAKGLEADIVFLVDADRGPMTSLGPVFELAQTSSRDNVPNKISVLVGGADRHIESTAHAREEKKKKAYEEYRRLLYVAATRAKDRLYICGVERGNDKRPREKQTGVKSWHSLAEDAFDEIGARIEAEDRPFWDNLDSPVRRLTCKQTARIQSTIDVAPRALIKTPPWLFTKTAPEAPAAILSPSRLAGEEDQALLETEKSAAYSPAQGEGRYFRGRTLHRLLELLPDIDRDRRQAAADKLLAHLAPDIDPAARARWREEVIAILNDKKFSVVFGAGSRAEVSIAGTPQGARPGLVINGQIDRLAVRDSEVLIVDYKTNRPPPPRIEETAPAYIAQMAAYRALLQEIYPDRQISSALLWTYDARLMPVPDSLMDHAFARYVAAG